MDLRKFLEAHERSYQTALKEILAGKKRSHWMWYIFPQIKGLGSSPTAQHYAIEDIAEAQAFLRHPVLGANLVEISTALLNTGTSDAHKIFGLPDDIKLRSSMTLFANVPGAGPVFGQVLQRFFEGTPDNKTLKYIKC